jgi:hypothetical protein
VYRDNNDFSLPDYVAQSIFESGMPTSLSLSQSTVNCQWICAVYTLPSGDETFQQHLLRREIIDTHISRIPHADLVF